MPPRSPPSTDAKLKDPKTFTLIGTDRVRRKDSQAKSDGTARFTQDVRLPDMLTAMVAHAPLFGGKVKSFDAAEARKVAGVVDVFEIPTGDRGCGPVHLCRPHGPRGAEARVERRQGREARFRGHRPARSSDVAAGKNTG